MHIAEKISGEEHLRKPAKNFLISQCMIRPTAFKSQTTWISLSLRHDETRHLIISRLHQQQVNSRGRGLIIACYNVTLAHSGDNIYLIFGLIMACH